MQGYRFEVVEFQNIAKIEVTEIFEVINKDNI